jgi:hypothetical protein
VVPGESRPRVPTLVSEREEIQGVFRVVTVRTVRRSVRKMAPLAGPAGPAGLSVPRGGHRPPPGWSPSAPARSVLFGAPRRGRAGACRTQARTPARLRAASAHVRQIPPQRFITESLFIVMQASAHMSATRAHVAASSIACGE